MRAEGPPPNRQAIESGRTDTKLKGRVSRVEVKVLEPEALDSHQNEPLRKKTKTQDKRERPPYGLRTTDYVLRTTYSFIKKTK